MKPTHDLSLEADMQVLLTPRQMADLEKRYFEEEGVLSIEAMEVAAAALAEKAKRETRTGDRVFVVCGPGGNGGDGYAAARLLQKAGRSCVCIFSDPAKTPDAKENLRRAEEAGVPVREDVPSETPALWIDAIYGTGLSRAPEGHARELIETMNASPAPVLSADIPSGLDGRTGTAYAPCVSADWTVAFQYAKTGHFLADGPDAAGKLLVRPIGMGMTALPENAANLADGRLLFEEGAGLSKENTQKENAQTRIAQKKNVQRRNVHKGTNGHLLLIAGSVGMAGAAALATGAALRSGAGLVTVACPQEIVPILQTLEPCAMCVPLPSTNGALDVRAASMLPELIRGKRAVAVGPGLSLRCVKEVVLAVLEHAPAAVFDADALNCIAQHGLTGLFHKNHVLTPHPGEAARLLGRACIDPLDDARALAFNGATAVLKGASRVITDGAALFISPTGAPGMAKGGSGDVFTGLVGGVLAQTGTVDAAKVAACCEIHGLAGKLAQAAKGVRGMTAQDTLNFLPEALLAYEK